MSKTPTNLGYTLEDARRHGFDLLALYELWHWNSCFPMSANHDLIRDATRAVQRELKERYVELPKDANDVPIHIGNMLNCGKVCRIEIANDGDHKVYFATRPDNPHLECHLCRYVHHKPPTVEDVLREFADEYDSVSGYAPDENVVLAKFAERLQLRERDDG